MKEFVCNEVVSSIYFLFCKRVTKKLGLLWTFQNILPRNSKLFIRLHLDHDDIIHVQAYNFAFHQKEKSFHYIASLAVTGNIRGTIREKFHQELGFESLQLSRWFIGLCFFVRICISKSSDYFLIPTINGLEQKHFHSIPQFKVKHNFFKNSCNG